MLNLPTVGRSRVSYLFDVGFTRDVWMHRIDIARATGHGLDLDADHDGRLIADIVAEWAGIHGEPFTLDLTGPAGGTLRAGRRRRTVTRSTPIEFLRILAERAHGDGVLGNPLPL